MINHEKYQKHEMGCRSMNAPFKSSFTIHYSSFAAGALSARLDEVIRKNLEELGYGE